jgi:8-oxo-dGTP diphosphatase
VVWRHASTALAAAVEVCMVHRQRYDDWSLPKGKLEKGEHPLAAALREVHEEAAVRAAPQLRLPEVRYSSHGTPKTVDYWSMRAITVDGFHPNDEVDEVRWVPLADAIDTASYAHDRDVLRTFAQLPPVTGVVLLFRHARAGKRESWPGEDKARPVDAVGESEAAALAELLALCQPGRLVSATPRRCVQTLAPLAAALDLPIEVDASFDEATNQRMPEAAGDRLVQLAFFPGTTVCSQGGVIAPTLARLVALHGGPRRPAEAYATGKGAGWLLAFAGDRLVGLDPIDPAQR